MTKPTDAQHDPACQFCRDDQAAAEELARGEGRRFSNAEDAIAWLQGADDEPAEPNALTRAAAQQMRQERERERQAHNASVVFRRPTAETADRPGPAYPTGYTIGVYLPPQASAEARDQLFDALAEAAHATEDGWEAHVVGLPGDPLGAVDGTARP